MRSIFFLSLVALLLILPGTAMAAAPTQSVACDKITANYHRALTNGDHINVTLAPHGQVNMYVDLNIAGGYNSMGLRWKILGPDRPPIPLTQAQVQSGIIVFNYGEYVPHNDWTVSFVQTNQTDTWPNLPCSKTPVLEETCVDAPGSLPVGASGVNTVFEYTTNLSNWQAANSGQTVKVTVTGLTKAQIPLGLASYEASSAVWETSLPQTLFDSDVKTLNGCETIEFEVVVPNCYYQLDFFTGALLTGTQLNNGVLYDNRKIRWGNGGQACALKKTAIKVKKVANRKFYRVGQVASFRIVAKNTGAVTAQHVQVCDVLNSSWKFVAASPGHVRVGNKICWNVAEVAAGKGRVFKVKAKLVGKVKSVKYTQTGDHVYVSKHEEQIDLEPGQTRTVQVSCQGGLVSDGSVRVDHVDHNTGLLTDVVIHESRAINLSTYQFTLTNNASGRAQAKGFVTCLPKQSVQNQASLVVKSAVDKTLAAGTGESSVKVACPSGHQPIAPGYNITSGSARLITSENIGANGWALGFAVATDAGVSVSLKCLRTYLGDGQVLDLSHVKREVTVAAGATVSESISCSDQAKGIVATHELPPKLVLLGHDPQPKTRVFRLHNPTDQPIKAMIDLVCVGDRTKGKAVKTYYPKAFNTVYVTAVNAKKALTRVVVGVKS